MANSILEKLEKFRNAEPEERARILLETPDSYLKCERRVLARDIAEGLPFSREEKEKAYRILLGLE